MTPAIALDARDPRPLYVQIADALTSSIERGDLVPDERLPPIRALAGELDVALVTVSQAYETLAARGRVVSRVGRGTFVAPQSAVDAAPFARSPRCFPAASGWKA
jgi:GntR family transcriptional regulator